VTNGYSITINSGSSSYILGETYRITTYYWLNNYSYGLSQSFYITIDTCSYTSITTNNVITGQNLKYCRDSGNKSYPFDSILSQTPDCGFTSWTYFLSGLNSNFITIDQTTSPATMIISS